MTTNVSARNKKYIHNKYNNINFFVDNNHIYITETIKTRLPHIQRNNLLYLYLPLIYLFIIRNAFYPHKWKLQYNISRRQFLTADNERVIERDYICSIQTINIFKGITRGIVLFARHLCFARLLSIRSATSLFYTPPDRLQLYRLYINIRKILIWISTELLLVVITLEYLLLN